MFGELVVDGERVARCDLGSATDDELCEAARSLARLASLIEVGQARVLAELDGRGVCERDFGLSAAGWLAREAKLPGAAPRSLVRQGQVAAAMPAVREASVDGRMSAAHLATLARVRNDRIADRLATLQDGLVGLAQGATFERWRAELRGIVDRLDEDGGHDPARDVARNELFVAESLDGVTHLTGRLVGEWALGVREAIDGRADDLFRRYQADHEACADVAVPRRATLRALALAELCRAGGAVDESSTRPPRPEVTMVIRADEPADVVDGTTGAGLADGTVRTLRCDADVHALVIDSLGVPLDMGRRVRLATDAQRRAIAVRDGGCVFPGATRCRTV